MKNAPNHQGVMENNPPSRVSKTSVPCFDEETAALFLGALGKDSKTTRIRAFYEKDDPRKNGDGGRKASFSTDTIKQWQQQGRGVYVVINNGGDEKKDITDCLALFNEWDDKPREWQKTAWKELGLPEPTLQVDSGGRSIHSYWVLASPIPPAQFVVLQKRLAIHCGSDTGICDAPRVMRLPGTVRGNGQPITLIHANGNRYDAAEFDGLLKALVQQSPSAPPPTAPSPTAPPRSLSEIREALSRIPPRVPGSGTYQQRDRNVLWGLIAAVKEAGGTRDQAIALMEHHSPQWRDVRQVAISGGEKINACTFWHHAREHGFELKRPHLQPQPARLQASLQAIIGSLKDGWKEDGKSSQLTPGHLAELLPAEKFRFNEMEGLMQVRTNSGWVWIRDCDIDSCFVLLTGKGWRIGLEPVTKALLHVARQQSFHPVREYLQQIEADPSIQPIDLNQVAPEFFRASAALHVAMIRAWLIGAVARVMIPGCQMDACLVLQGDQGLGKSRALEALASPDWYCSTVPDHDKDFLLNVHSCWIFELAELEGVTGRREEGRLKNLITTAVDRFRPPYGRSPERMPRQSVFAGSVNPKQFLRDDTGNRRFWVVPIEGTTNLDTAAITASRDRIWKAAIEAWRSGERAMLPAPLARESEQQNAEFRSHDPWLEMLQRWIEGDPLGKVGERGADPMEPFTTAEALISAGLRAAEQIGKSDQMRIAKLLRELGYEQGWCGSSRIWLPPRPQDPPRPTATSEQVGRGD